MIQKFSIRPALPTDVEAVQAVHTSAIRDSAPEHYAPEVVEVWVDAFNPENFPKNIERMEFFVAEIPAADSSVPGSSGEGGHEGFAREDQANAGQPRIAAFLAFDLNTREVDSVYVAPWGRGLGLGTYLLDFAEETAREAGLEELWLDASVNAVSFYGSRGWTTVEEHVRTRKGVDIQVVKMEKPLE